jgi:hypothetical protein
MRKTSTRIILGTVLTAANLVSASDSVSAGKIICPMPPMDLSKQKSTPSMPIDEEVVNFVYRSKTYEMDIRSAFAQQNSSNASNYCIRYEATNKADDSIEKFFWPLPNIELDSLDSRKTISLVVTKPPGPPPAIDETWLYSFLNSAAKSAAYQQKHAELRQQFPRLALLGDSRKLVELARLERLAAIDSADERYLLKKFPELADVGSSFSDGNQNVLSSISKASWDGKLARIAIVIERNNEKNSVIAPVSYALAKASDGSEFLFLVRQFQKEPLPMGSDNLFDIDRSLSPQSFGNADSLYLIQQPITLITPTGKACYSSPIYSPMPLPSGLLRCNLF